MKAASIRAQAEAGTNFEDSSILQRKAANSIVHAQFLFGWSSLRDPTGSGFGETEVTCLNSECSGNATILSARVVKKIAASVTYCIPRRGNLKEISATCK